MKKFFLFAACAAMLAIGTSQARADHGRSPSYCPSGGGGGGFGYNAMRGSFYSPYRSYGYQPRYGGSLYGGGHHHHNHGRPIYGNRGFGRGYGGGGFYIRSGNFMLGIR